MRSIPKSTRFKPAAGTSGGKFPVKTMPLPPKVSTERLKTWAAPGIGIKQVVAMTEQLTDLLEAGLPLDRALHITSETMEGSRLQAVVINLVLEVEKGKTLGAAVATYPNVFPRLYINMIKAGEEGGFLGAVLQRLTQYYKNRLEFRSYLITASIYPMLLLIFGVASVIGLVTFVLPKFGEIFSGLNQPMPPTASALISVGDVFREYGLHMLVFLLLFAVGFKQALKNLKFKEQIQTAFLYFPLVGDLIQKANLSSICRTWGTLLMGNVPILTGLRIVRELTDNIPLQKAIDRLSRAVQEGKGVASPLMNDAFFPKLMGQMVRVGEEAGALDAMLIKIANSYESDVKKSTSSLVAVFEPAMILIVGALIGLIVISMLGAIFAINDMPL